VVGTNENGSVQHTRMRWAYNGAAKPRARRERTGKSVNRLPAEEIGGQCRVSIFAINTC